MKNTFLIFILLSFFVFNSCDIFPPPPLETKNNYIILLDLSDRIDPSLHPQQIQSDLNIVNLLFSFFEQDVKKVSSLVSKDEFHIFVAPQKNMSQDVLTLQKQLELNMEATPIARRKNAIPNFRKALEPNLKNLYNYALVGKANSQNYAGADIWKFMNDDLQNLLKKDTGNVKVNNYLFIITDGYIYFESVAQSGKLKQNHRFSDCSFIPQIRSNFEHYMEKEDYGLIPVKKTFPNLKAMVLQINPKQEHALEYDMLKAIWEKWLREMKISTTVQSFAKTGISVTNLQTQIQNFLGKKIIFQTHTNSANPTSTTSLEGWKPDSISINTPNELTTDQEAQLYGHKEILMLLADKKKSGHIDTSELRAALNLIFNVPNPEIEVTTIANEVETVSAFEYFIKSKVAFIPIQSKCQIIPSYKSGAANIYLTNLEIQEIPTK